MKTVNAYAAINSGEKLLPYTYKLSEIGNDEVDIKILYCGICHSDISMIDNAWGVSEYPLIAGHEVIGQVIAIGSNVKNLKIGDYVGVGWNSESCMYCNTCLNGDQHICLKKQPTIIGNHGGFADLIRAHWAWTILLPKKIDLEKAGPLLCAGITVFSPLILHNIKPTAKVGVIGIGGLGHLALKFLNKWGCEVVAFTSSKNKKDSILKMGASKVIDSTNVKEFESIKNSLDLIISTVNVTLNWNNYIATLNQKGILHFVGATPEPLKISARSLIANQKTVSGSTTGNPFTIKEMLDFSVRHDIYPIVETFKMKDINNAIAHLRKGKARYRIVLKA